MKTADATVEKLLAAQTSATDGRRARSSASRAKIIRAMMDLIVEGDMNPSAANTAKRAGVGLRTLFRLFDDKDEIFRAIDVILVEAYQPIIEAPYAAVTWRGQLDELIERRCEVSEAIAPYRVATSAAGRQSPFLRENYRRLHTMEKARLDAILPAQWQTHKDAGRAILVATSFDTWRFLRQEEDLSEAETVNAIKRLVDDIVGR